MIRTQIVMRMISRITKISLLVLSSLVIFGCATVDFSEDAPKEDVAEITGSWRYYALAGRHCEITTVNEQEIPHFVFGARTITVRPGLHKIMAKCEGVSILHGGSIKTRPEFEFNAKKGHKYYIESNIFGVYQCARVIDKDSKEVVATDCVEPPSE